jgi:two-component system, NarL family, response regulator NreC
MRRKTQILVIDAEGLVRDGLCALLQREEGLHLAGTFDTPRNAVRARGDLSPDIAIIDFALAMKSGPQTLIHLKRRWPNATVLTLSASAAGENIEAARRAGADGYVLRNDKRSELFNALRTLAQKKHYISSSVLASAPTRPGGGPHRRRTDGTAMLTNREQEVVALIAEGYRTREMAQLLSVSHKTVERHRTNLMRKLGVRSATGVVAYAITHGYVGF